MVHDELGQPRTASLADYSLITAAEVPPIETEFVESPSPANPLGAKGIGEAGSIGTPAALANAIADALGGRRVDPPFTPDKLWRAAWELETSAEPAQRSRLVIALACGAAVALLARWLWRRR
jgi:carbon-monoxide dehydrogenase large subunit